MKKTTIRLTAVQSQILEKLADKLLVDQTNVIRIAIARLAEQEGISLTDKR
jgi:hypothetical protein